MTTPTMKAKFKRVGAFGKERFRGLVIWTAADGVTTCVECSHTWANKEFAMDDALAMRNVLRKRDWTQGVAQ